MQESRVLLKAIGTLVVAKRSSSMDQTELGQRVGVGRNTISSIENGKGVNAETLFKVLEYLDITQDIQAVIDQKLQEQNNRLSRKSRKIEQELDNDF